MIDKPSYEYTATLEDLCQALARYDYPANVLQVLISSDIIRASGAYNAMWTPDRNIYRVAISPTLKRVEVVSIGVSMHDSAADAIYTDISELPDWMQERLHAMMLLSETPPTEYVEGLGRRISTYVFWLDVPEGEV